MFSNYWQKIGSLDYLIFVAGAVLLLVQVVFLIGEFYTHKNRFHNNLSLCQRICGNLTELLPLAGLLGTVLALLTTFQSFEISPGKGPDISALMTNFSPALTTTISGLLMVIPNLILNTLLYWACNPEDTTEEGKA